MRKAPKSKDSENQEPSNADAESHDIKLHESKKPGNLPANVMPTGGFVLSVDGKLKTQYESENAAMAAGTKLKQSYPVIQVSVYDANARVYRPVELAAQDK